MTADSPALSAAGWRLIPDGAHDGAWNMAADEALASAVGAGQAEPTLRLYGWVRPTVSLGFLQRGSAGVDRAACLRRGIPLVRRITGGRALLHAEELTYSVAVPLAGPWGALSVPASFRALSMGLVEMLRRLGVPATIGPSGEGDGGAALSGLCFLARRMPAILVEGRKLVGSAQRRSGAWLLQHGSLLLDLDHELQRAVFPAWPPDAARRITCLRELLGRRPGPDELAAALGAAWSARFGGPCRYAEATPSELSEAERLVAVRYGKPEWTDDR
jgi:lipoate-protein ligase A